MQSAYDIWLSAPYCDKKNDGIDAYEEQAKDRIRVELMDDDIFAAEAALYCHSSINSLYYLSKAARGKHDQALASKIASDITYSDKTADEKYVVSATEGNHDTALAAKIKAALVEQIVDARWTGLALSMSKFSEAA